MFRERNDVRRNIGLVFQETTLDGYLTAEQDLRLHAELYGVDSAWTSASSRIASAPMPHEMIAAGPAVASAPWAPKSHPEPMIEPHETQSSPMNPISRRRPGLC
jgi:hypothetical protein